MSFLYILAGISNVNDHLFKPCIRHSLIKPKTLSSRTKNMYTKMTTTLQFAFLLHHVKVKRRDNKFIIHRINKSDVKTKTNILFLYDCFQINYTFQMVVF